MPLFSRNKQDGRRAGRERDDGLDERDRVRGEESPDEERLPPDDPRKPDSPTDLSKQSWLGVAKRAFKEFKDDNVTDWAAALTYYAVLSIFPALIVFVSLLGLFGQGADTVQKLLDIVRDIGAPRSAVDALSGPIEDVVNQQAAIAGTTLVLGLLGALWSASGYVGAFIRASNAIYEVEEGRKFYILRPLQMLVTLVLIVLLALVLVALVVTGPVAKAVGEAVGVGSSAVTVWDIVKWPVLLAVVTGMIALLYYASPNAKLRGFKSILPGSALAVVVWLIASAGFAFYVSNFGSYNKTYGALGGVVIFLVWLWITNVAILLGAELNAERERSRELEAGTPDAERELQLDERTAPKANKRARTV